MRAAAERRCDASDKLFLVGRTLVVVTFDVFAKKVDMNDEDKIISKTIYEQV